MQRIVPLLLSLVPALVAGQQSAGAELWRLAATTLPVPPALASGAAAVFWNPAQLSNGERARFGLEAIATPPALGATGVLAAARLRARWVGQLGLVYGRMQLGDLVRTSLSPDPDPGTIPYFTQTVGLNWSGATDATAVGATLAFQDTKLDMIESERWTFDVGVRRRIGDLLHVALATHFFSGLTTRSPSQDLYGGIEYRVWRGPLWTGGSPAAIVARYGIAAAHGFTADHEVGAGVAFGDLLAADLLVVREGGFDSGGWRAIGGIGLGIGRYRVSFARDAGFDDIGAAYRVGLETRVP